MGKEIRKLLLINKISEELMIKEKLNKIDALAKAKEMIRAGKINIENGQVYNETTGEVIIDF
ncbi:MAG: hypothetical protein E7C49_11495 [Clostridium sp.]|nr:hypothetical protein [Clostridium sp.]